MPQHPPNLSTPSWYAPDQYGLPAYSDATMQHSMPGPNAHHSTTNLVPGSVQESEISASVRQSASGNPGPSNPNRVQDAASARTAAPRRSRYGTLDWESHKSLLQRLYLTENKTLNETMKIMKDEHSFNASAKLYKDKFKEWQWQKYLPAKQANFMVRKAQKRKREEGKKTVFSYGGTVWTSQQAEKSSSRSKKARHAEDLTDVDTPSVGISYKTPKAIGPSPSAALVDSPAPNLAAPSPRIVQNEGGEPRDLGSDHEEMESLDGAENRSLAEDVEDVEPGDSEDESDASVEALPLRWKGFSRGELLSMWKAAQGHIKSGEFQTAEKLLLQVLKGYRFLFGPIHKDANEVVYALANLYAQNDRMPEADETIEGLSRELVEKLGYAHKRTQQHVLHVVELLNSWRREEDAMGLLAHSKELVEQGRAVDQTRVLRSGRRVTTNNGRGKGKGKRRIRPADESDDELSIEDITHMVMRDDSPDNLRFGLTIARSHVTAKDEAVEGLLIKIIELCETSLRDRHVQYLTARAELLRLYQTCGSIDDNMGAYTKSEDVFNAIWETYDWDREKFSSLEVMEAGMQLALEMFKAAFEDEAKNMFNQVSETANMVFHADDERTIWILISIGLAYQTYGTWGQAERWFEHALANALSVWNDHDGIVESLQKGVDEKHFSYVSDEGRPFKTIFGVSGIWIRPSRLHMC